MRGPRDINHAVDMDLKYRFVDRGGRYVYEVRTASSKQVMGFMRVDWEEGKVVSFDAIPVNQPEEKKPEQGELPLPLPGDPLDE